METQGKQEESCSKLAWCTKSTLPQQGQPVMDLPSPAQKNKGCRLVFRKMWDTFPYNIFFFNIFFYDALKFSVCFYNFLQRPKVTQSHFVKVIEVRQTRSRCPRYCLFGWSNYGFRSLAHVRLVLSPRRSIQRHAMSLGDVSSAYSDPDFLESSSNPNLQGWRKC